MQSSSQQATRTRTRPSNCSDKDGMKVASRYAQTIWGWVHVSEPKGWKQSNTLDVEAWYYQWWSTPKTHARHPSEEIFAQADHTHGHWKYKLVLVKKLSVIMDPGTHCCSMPTTRPQSPNSLSHGIRIIVENVRQSSQQTHWLSIPGFPDRKAWTYLTCGKPRVVCWTVRGPAVWHKSLGITIRILWDLQDRGSTHITDGVAL